MQWPAYMNLESRHSFLRRTTPKAIARQAEAASSNSQHPSSANRPLPYQLKASSRALLERRKAEQAARKAATASQPAADEGSDANDAQQPSSSSPQEPSKTFFRFWHDEKRFKGSGADSLVQRALLAAGGERTGGRVKSDPRPGPGPLGWQRVGSWDVLWSPASTALQAVSGALRRHQLVCAVQGSQSLSRKKRLPETLTQAYGAEGAACLVPLTFQLPSQLGEWREFMAAHNTASTSSSSTSSTSSSSNSTSSNCSTSPHSPSPPGGSSCGGGDGAPEGFPPPPPPPPAPLQQQQQQHGRLWMLKTSQHLGKGLQLVTQQHALDAVLRRQAQVLSYMKNQKQQQQQQRPQSPPSQQSQQQQQQHDQQQYVLQHHHHHHQNHHPEGGGGGPRRRRLDPDRPRPFVVAQKYVDDPLLINNRKFGIRLWLVVVGSDPLRAYLHKNGLILFSTEPYDAAAVEAATVTAPYDHSGAVGGDAGGSPLGAAVMLAPSADGGGGEEEEAEEEAEVEEEGVNDGGGCGGSGGNTAGMAMKPPVCTAGSPPAALYPPPPPPPPPSPPPSSPAPRGHVTNYAQNVDGEVWSLRQLANHLGTEKFSLLYRRILRSAALTAAAAVPHIRSETARLRVPYNSQGGGCFELFGLDFLVDKELRPWLLEVNATPSLAVQHTDPRVEQLIRREKEGMVADMVSLLRLDRRYGSRHRTHRIQHDDDDGEGGDAAEEGAVGDDGDGGGAGALRALLQATYPQVFYDSKLLDVMEFVEWELAAKGNFLPLMPLFPQPSKQQQQQQQQPAGGGLKVAEVASATAVVEEAAECGYLLDAGKLPPGYGSGLGWSTADRLVRAWCRDRDRLLYGAASRTKGGGPVKGDVGDQRPARLGRRRGEERDWSEILMRDFSQL